MIISQLSAHRELKNVLISQYLSRFHSLSSKFVCDLTESDSQTIFAFCGCSLGNFVAFHLVTLW